MVKWCWMWLRQIKTCQTPKRTWSPEVSEAFFELGCLTISGLLDWSKWSKTADSGGFWSYLQMVNICKLTMKTLGQLRATTQLTFDLYNLGMQNSTQTLHGSTSADPISNNLSFRKSSPCGSHVLCLRDRATLARVLLAWTLREIGMAFSTCGSATMGSNGLMTHGLPLVWKWWNHPFWANRSKVVFDVFDLFSGKDSILASWRMFFCQALFHGTSWQMRLAALVAARMMCFGEAPCTQTQQDHRTGCLGTWWNPHWKLGPSHVFFWLLERRFGIGELDPLRTLYRVYTPNPSGPIHYYATYLSRGALPVRPRFPSLVTRGICVLSLINIPTFQLSLSACPFPLTLDGC